MGLSVVLKLSPENRKEEVEGFVRRHLEAKLSKIETRWGKPLAVRLSAEEQTNGFVATLSLMGEGEIVGKHFGDKLPKAVDGAIDKVTRQFEESTQKREGKERQRRLPVNGKVPAEF